MPRVCWLLLVIVLAAGSAVAALPRPAATFAVREAVDAIPVDDPFPIRRVRGTDARLPDLLKELDPGPTVRMPRAEFESRVRAAGRSALAAKHSARVVDARYSAEFDAGELTGTAEIGILNARGVTGFVPLDPLKLAIRSAKWGDGSEAILTVPQGAPAPAVWLNHDGRRVLQLGWSLAGTTEPGERRFELRVPPCAASRLELKLPADQVPTASADVLLTGPFPVANNPARRLWRLRFGGQSKVEFAIRSTNASSGGVQAKLDARYELAPGQLTATFEYDLQSAHGSVGEWSFLADPGLRIIDVATINRAGWSVDAPAVPDGPRRVRVNLRQPGPSGKVIISAAAPFPDAARPTEPLPTIRPLNAVLDEEKLHIRVASTLRVEGWTAGDYRLTEAATPLLVFPGESSRVLSLVGTLLSPGADEPFRRMPTLRVSTSDADFTTVERLEWRLGPSRASLNARVTLRVRRGALFQLSVRPPQGFTISRDASGPEELVSYVHPLSGGTQTVEFARPIPAGQSAELRLELLGPSVKAGDAIPFPAFVVNGATEREGWLSVAAASQWSLTTRAGAGASAGGLWGWLTTDSPGNTDALFLFRGKEPEGTVMLADAKPVISADANVRLDAAGGSWNASTRLTLKVTGGELPSLVAFVSDSNGNRQWKLLDDSNTITDAVSVPRALLNFLPLLAPRETLAGLVGAGARGEATGTVWVLRFARPLTGTTVLETTATGAAVGDNAVPVPVPHVLGAIQTTRAEVAPALQDRTEATPSGDSVLVRTVSRGGLGPPRVSDAYLVTAVRSRDDVLAVFGGTVRGSRGAPLQLLLPAGAEVRGVCISGKWLNPAACAERDSDGSLRLPLPAEPAVRFEVRYQLPVATEWPTRRVVSPVPGVVGGNPEVKRWWSFASSTLPGWPARPWETTTDEPPLLGGPLTSSESVTLVTLSDDETVRVGLMRTADALAASLAVVWILFGLIAVFFRLARSAIVLSVAVVVLILVAELGPPWWSRVAWPPLIAATGVLAVVLVVLVTRTRFQPSPVAATAVACVMLFAGYSVTAIAQQPAPATVVIVTEDGKEEVVASRALMDRLDSLARPPLPAPVVTSAEYDLHADENIAHVVAKLVVHAFRDSDNVLSLPLADARLERVTVNGKAAFPTSPRADTYSIALPNPGRHEVELRFVATLTANGPDREARFGVPEVPLAKLTATLPGAARQPQVAGLLGRQIISTGDRAKLEADLGAVKAVQVRWREGTGGAAVVKVHEGCIWDIKEEGADLTAAYNVRVDQGAVGGMRFEIPRELEVLSVSARTSDVLPVTIPLRDWTLAAEKGGTRLLHVDFQNPTTGRFLIVLQCAPRKPITRQPVLRFPRVSFGNVTGETEAVYGLRSRVAVDNVGLAGVIDFPPDAFKDKDFSGVDEFKLTASNPVRAFQPTSGGAAELRPALRVGEPVSARTVTAWQVGPHRADASGSITWSGKDSLPMLEFNLLSAKVLEVRGAEVAAWNQSGTRVQVWLRAGGASFSTLEWIATATPTPSGKGTADSVFFEPSHPQVLNARASFEEVRARPIEGWSVKTDRARGWQATSLPTGELRFREEAPGSPPLRVQLSHNRGP